MKKWTGFFVLLVVLTLVAYYAIGLTIKSTLNKNINSIPKSSAFNVRLHEYHSGWFSSHAIISIKMHIPAQTTTDKNGVAKTEPPVDFDTDIPILIKHGPFIVTNYGIRFGMGIITTQPETHYEAFINYLNRTIFRYTLPSLAIEGKIGQNEGDFQLSWDGLTSLLSVSSNLDRIEGNLELLGLSGSANNPANTGSNVIFKVGGITYDFNLKRYQDWLWLGHSRFDIPTITINLAGTPLFELTRFNFLARSDVSHEALTIDFKLSLQKLFANNQTYGPGIMHLSIRNLDPIAAAKINQQEFSMMQNNSDPNMISLAFLNELPQLLAKGAVIELSQMTLNLPDGKIAGNFKITLPKNESNNLSQIMQKLQGEGSFKAPMATVKTLLIASLKNESSPNDTQANPVTSPASTTSPTQILTNPDNDADKKADKILQDLVSKGFLKIEGTDYTFTFKLENQKIIVNGKVFNPDQLR
ncbi:YdgA family protein [Legionella sp. PATHC038]|uniref:YdgA family protein n=1 Tax=Legionella sheltonii TaxID=2992041 RepID=UPI002244290C|nr:YdgA family protein [Legionella sp. PATHC038]MCW8398049.1 YdgA family protein [Legionella sp. PATHC038]